MPRRFVLTMLLAGALPASVVIDRVAVVVDKRVIKASDIYRDLRVTQFLNRQPPDFNPEARRKAAERLIDQMIIRDEIQKGDYAPAGADEVEAMLKQIRHERFGDSDARLKQELSRYGLTEDQLRMELQWQFDVLTFLDQRFRAGVLVTTDEVRSYYDQNRAKLQQAYPQINTFEAMEPKVRATLEGERLNQDFEQWLKQERARNRIEYRQEAFQ
jgi:peptidyl-prolyl cis-trans isomerase SurA